VVSDNVTIPVELQLSGSLTAAAARCGIHPLQLLFRGPDLYSRKLYCCDKDTRSWCAYTYIPTASTKYLFWRNEAGGYFFLSLQQSRFRTLKVSGSFVTLTSSIFPAAHHDSTLGGSTLIAHSFLTPAISVSVATSSLSFVLVGLDAYRSRKISCCARNRTTIPRLSVKNWPIYIRHDVCFTPQKVILLSFLQISLTSCIRKLMRREWH
jgi:hypothetical protein